MDSRKILQLQQFRNKRRAAIRDAQTPIEARLDLQLQRLVDELDEREQGRENRIRKLEDRLLQVTGALNELLSRLEEP
jgi:hypothetical protein